MDESFEMKDGSIVKFYSALSYGGINIRLENKLPENELRQFKKEIKEQRDVVSIINGK
jgi:hypothetical protein